jgi:hypothetical protein
MQGRWQLANPSNHGVFPMAGLLLPCAIDPTHQRARTYVNPADIKKRGPPQADVFRTNRYAAILVDSPF